MAPPCEFQICLLIGQENVYLRREIAKALPIGQDVPPCTLHSSFFEGVNKRFPLKRQPKMNSSVIYFDIFTISTSDCDLKVLLVMYLILKS